jgi:hypothetical protein
MCVSSLPICSTTIQGESKEVPRQSHNTSHPLCADVARSKRNVRAKTCQHVEILSSQIQIGSNAPSPILVSFGCSKEP